ncbi:hypothetical protein T233_01611 [Vagococcus lutrae LBD1]|uniref:Carbohydrate kinase PfkB domain-containing protein n=1 Tax=Vagococcus lutrae LBD1 TaxID=1408226 RepID=V6Q9F4_9ENTE|nr:sugar kinase [Vagococcus lutrae]EST89163.1 hypothetical protein T233_01611 [Vagococcus lutrae LBD1]
MTDVLLIGEPMVIFYANEYGKLSEVSQFTKGLAGAEVNVGIGLSRLGHSVSYITKLNHDEMGKYIFNSLEKEKFDLSFTRFDENLPVGIMYKNKVDSGDPETLYYRKGSAASTLSVEDVENIDFSKIKLFHITGIPAALSDSLREAIFFMIKKAKKQGCTVTFDPNLRPSLWQSEDQMIQKTNEIAMLSDIFLPGLSEAQLLTKRHDVDEIADYYLQNGIQTIILKNGENGAYIKEKNKEIKNIEGFKVTQVIDTVGAGDGFAVGIIDSILRNLTIEEGCVNANAIGAIQIQHASDNEALPSTQELITFKQKYNR